MEADEIGTVWRVTSRTGFARPFTAGSNQAWAMDFVSDQCRDGRRFRARTVVDIYTRESVAIEAGQSLRGERKHRMCGKEGWPTGMGALIRSRQRG